MLPSSIGASAEARAAEITSVRASTWSDGRGTSGATFASPLGLGPLAHAAGRLLGSGGRQAFQSVAIRSYDRMFPGPPDGRISGLRPHIAPMRDAWIAARVLPTPNGYVRGAGAYMRSS
jgi:hypothetical protein